MRYLQIVHAMSGRTRLRCPVLREEKANALRIADALAAIPGVHEVTVRPFTGSVLVQHDPSLTAEHLVETSQAVLRCERVVARGEAPPIDAAISELSKIAKLAIDAFRDIDREVLRVSDGSLDLGTLATLGFVGAGAVQVAIEREVEMPPWFTLAWWGYRMFMTNATAEILAIDRSGH